jgi:hypothetical protein
MSHNKMWAALLLAPLFSGCGKLSLEADTRAQFEILLKVNTDNNVPVQGAILQLREQTVGTTGPEGSSVLKFTANEGESFDIAVKCPTGLQSPPKAVLITLRKLADVTRRPEFTAACPSATKVVVVAVRADGGPNLPVMYLGNEVGRTDQSGAANVALRLAPNDTFELQLNTSDKSNERLRPQNPSLSFTMKEKDDVVVFETKFSLEAKKVVAVGKKALPKRI